MRQLESQFGLSFEYLWPYDAVDLTDEDTAPFDLPKKTSISSARKHLLAQERLVSSGHDFAIVLEDDAILYDDFNDRLAGLIPKLEALSGDWIVNLAGADSKVDERFLSAGSENELIERRIATVEGYVINRSGAEKRLNEFKKNGMDLAFDHWLQRTDEALRIPHYWVAKPMLRQGSVTGEFATVLDSSRGNKPAWFLKLKFAWNVFRRQTLPRVFSNLKALVNKGH